MINSGHETTVFPFKEGMAALVIKDGNEHFTIQYAPDGINFEIASITMLMPTEAGPFISDAFTNTTNGRGITWDISHITSAIGWETNLTILLRFDCDLSLDVNDPDMKHHNYYYRPEHYYKRGLNKKTAGTNSAGKQKK